MRYQERRGDGVRVSVVVTTCNGASRLPRLFDALTNQTITGRIPFEVILVDNRSTDSTAQVTGAFAAESVVPVVYAFEGRQGKAYGLNAGVALARGPIIAFTDDDGIPSPEWLETILSYFGTNPDIACIGGRVELYDPADASVTVRRSRQPEVFDVTKFAVSNVPVIGCNLAIRSEQLYLMGPYDTALGPGSRVGSGDDIDMLYRLLRAGSRAAYVPMLLVLHNHGRRTEAEVKRVHERYIIGRGAFYCNYLFQGDRRIARNAYWEVTALLKAWVRNGLLTTDARGSLRTIGLLIIGAHRYIRHGHLWKRSSVVASRPLTCGLDQPTRRTEAD